MVMIGLDTIMMTIRTALWTPYVHGHRPVSVMIVSHPQRGKTWAMEHGMKTPNILYLTDVTPWAIVDELKNAHNKNLKVNHLIIPDFVNPMARKGMAKMVAILNSYTEEGVSKIKTYFQDITFVPPMKGGLITATTFDDFSSNCRKWEGMGFLSRMMIISYDYSDEVLKKIRDYCDDPDSDSETIDYWDEDFPKQSIDVKVTIQQNRVVGNLMGDHIRRRKLMYTMLKARTIMAGRQIVTDDDVHDIINMSRFFNTKLVKI